MILRLSSKVILYVLSIFKYALELNIRNFSLISFVNKKYYTCNVKCKSMIESGRTLGI